MCVKRCSFFYKPMKQYFFFFLVGLLCVEHAHAQSANTVFLQAGISNALYFGNFGAPTYGVGYARTLKPKWSIAADYTYCKSSVVLNYNDPSNPLSLLSYSPTETNQTVSATVQYEMLKPDTKHRAQFGVGASLIQNEVVYQSDYYAMRDKYNYYQTQITPTESKTTRVMANFSLAYQYALSKHFSIGACYAARLLNTQYLTVTRHRDDYYNPTIINLLDTQFVGRIGISNLLLRVGYCF